MTTNAKVYKAIGLMSGTALDGEIDVALIETDGQTHVRALDFYAHPYAREIREEVRACFGKTAPDKHTQAAETLVTDIHIEAVKKSGFKADIIGFHGQTITHAPKDRFTWQLGDGARLARETGIPVVSDMRQSDIKAGGQGAPLLPLYHKARLSEHETPVAVLNIGGVSNITYIDSQNIIAFDCGPGNALMDDYTRQKTGTDFDKDGALASKGSPDHTIAESFLNDAYLKAKPPKSLDRNHWSLAPVIDLQPQDALATLIEVTTGAVEKALETLPEKPSALYACGGGRKNAFLLKSLAIRLAPITIAPVEALGWNGDATESEGFAYLAVRSLLNLPLTLPSTTGTPQPLTGGVLHKTRNCAKQA